MTEEAIEAAAEQIDEPTVEDRAREMGWRPKEEFKGDDTKWVDAETFVKRGEEILPILRATAKKDREALEAAKAEIAEMKKTFSEFKRYHSATEQRALEKARKELEREMAEAVEAKDHQAVREIANEMASLSKDVRTDDDGNDMGSPQMVAFKEEWERENPWINTDPDLKAYAFGICQDMAAKGVKPKDQLIEAAKKVRQAFPHKFENERRKAPAAVEGQTPPRKAGKTRSDLPPEARQTMDRWVKQGLITEARYLKDYFG